MKHFINSGLMAPNVLTVSVDQQIVDEFLPLTRDPEHDAGHVAVKPPWSSDIRWLSPASPETFERYEGAFSRLGVAEHVKCYLDLELAVRLYAGFIVMRSSCDSTNFHYDWDKTNNEAFTLITPITSNTTGFGLLYRKLNGEIGEYEYRAGEAIIFGDHFIHSTKPGKSAKPVALLSFTFGTDKMEHWEKIFRTAGYQSHLVCRPDGQFVTFDR